MKEINETLMLYLLLLNVCVRCFNTRESYLLGRGARLKSAAEHKERST